MLPTCARGVCGGAGAGARDLGELKAHPFFSGVDWVGLRAQPPPAFVAPELESLGSDTGSFDWELQVGLGGWVSWGKGALGELERGFFLVVGAA